MKIIRATYLGMCFGVRDAIALAETQAQEQPLTILGDLVHNETVLTDLRAQGIRIAQRADQVKTRNVMITAHGASQKTIQHVRGQGLEIFEATCPLVHYAHRSVRQLVSEGYHPIIIGKRDHVEVRGVTEDLVAFDVVLNEADVERLNERPRFGIASQTTQPIERVRHLVRCIEKKFPQSEVRFIDTVCQPTKLRQNAAVELAKNCDVVIVIGGEHSNNTHELVATCSKHCSRVHHIQSAEELRIEWFDGVDTTGITAGTSTPDRTIDAVEQWLRLRHRVAQETRTLTIAT
ncbi:MAG: 4-hydroxy-3-methylbut-2-enyl diphosphate reductase [Verrucomicrobiales bacterium]|nr:4-hydroxy-3-methylbut-2-enyl diphosphate reductase [Verrucomicrobiales bacterium]